jgi:alcohol dehydrogenase
MLSGRELAMEVARSMIRFSSDIGFQTTLLQVEGYSRMHMERALEAAKNPQLKMKLENMPVPLDAGQVERYLRPVLMAAETGNLEIIDNAW